MYVVPTGYRTRPGCLAAKGERNADDSPLSSSLPARGWVPDSHLDSELAPPGSASGSRLRERQSAPRAADGRAERSPHTRVPGL
ncbi:hypothetical protein NDU88_000021 [Pleurodeles waltl]|uniref:Uncharacterized protein n=1 Tax=Pleurodeles waltl TaxID=8319 RepID=A0AAV7LUN9_PLEWA|nr:hypothetical protein NDU88_000021 [Pleurodeles waltl]